FVIFLNVLPQACTHFYFSQQSHFQPPDDKEEANMPDQPVQFHVNWHERVFLVRTQLTIEVQPKCGTFHCETGDHCIRNNYTGVILSRPFHICGTTQSSRNKDYNSVKGSHNSRVLIEIGQ